jgi:hypothetical protein
MGRPQKSKPILRYGYRFPPDADDLDIELSAIRHLGHWTDGERQCGNGLAFHVKRAIQLIWPPPEGGFPPEPGQIYWHRWADLMITEMCKEGRLALFGPSSSGKSMWFVLFALIMFYARPDGTSVVISSTTLDALQSRIWDYVVQYHKYAKQRYDWLPGSLIESRQKLLADPSDAEARSLKNGIVGVALKKGGQWQGLAEFVGRKNEVMIVGCDELSFCFVSGTMVDTPEGEKPIESLWVGDRVWCAAGVGRITKVFRRVSNRLVTIKTGLGRTITTTPDHPFFTQDGWKKACQLDEKSFIVATHEALRILRTANHSGRSSILWQQLRFEMVETETSCGPHETDKIGASVLSLVQNRESEGPSKSVLQSELLVQMEAGSTWFQRETRDQSECHNEAAASRASRMGSGNDREERSPHTRTVGGNGTEGQQALKGNGPQAIGSWRERDRTYTSRKSFDGTLPECDMELRDSDISKSRFRLPRMLQSGFGFSVVTFGGGSGRGDTQQSGASLAGREEDCVLVGDWVDSVTVHESEDTSGAGRRGVGTEVYNIEVDIHPSYSVSGLLVHNCPSGVTDSLANLESNEHCFACFMGNLPNIYNPLAKAAEPKEGWESFPETEKSRVYQTRWKNGRAIQLIGMDSPNLDYPEGAEPFKGLIGRRYIEQQAYNYGRDSDMFNMFASGKLPKASMNRVAVPRHLCLKFHAMERAVWGHHKLTIGYAMDVAYSGLGGDRTVGVPFMFGKDNVGAWRFMLGPMKLYAGSSTKEVSHAEAIARDVRAECEAHGVLPEHFFYDGTGRSEFTIALGRTWSTAVVPIEFGGPATERICFTGERHFGNDRDGEPKTCREVFDRFVTELWFAIRECVAADQARGFSEELVEELNGRLFEIVRGSKYSIEPKDGEKEGRPVGMKARGLRSPDYSDCTATALEGARRLGFPLGKAAMAKSRQDDRWLDSLRDDDWKRANEDTLTT